jgi:hypothetical protein
MNEPELSSLLKVLKWVHTSARRQASIFPHAVGKCTIHYVNTPLMPLIAESQLRRLTVSDDTI